MPPLSRERIHRCRREFLRFLAASPCLAALPPLQALEAMFQQQAPDLNEQNSTARAASNDLSSPAAALDVMDFKAAARKKIPIAHWAYLASGVDDDYTLYANHEAYRHIYLRPRRLVDATGISMKTELFGTEYDSPIFICPIGEQKAWHPEGEFAVARAARAKNTLQVLSNLSTTTVEDVGKALGRAPWFQLYALTDWKGTEKMIRRAEAAGCPVLVLTVDVTTGRNPESFQRMRRMDPRNCSVCHQGEPGTTMQDRPMYQGIDMTGLNGRVNPAMDWRYVDKLKKATSMKLVIKGLETREDAQLCLLHGADGIIVSNHGGRATETDRATIDALPEIVEAAGNRIPVMVDGGVRRGTDAFKALALGARAVGIGRPYIWGLGAFGQPGVERVLELLQKELHQTMANCGTHALADITRDRVGFARPYF
jgi:isopentenyl diphosphate isomerase/L-lactate dehydrogenase-like FMN-dependent dehydrogenase